MLSFHHVGQLPVPHSVFKVKWQLLGLVMYPLSIQNNPWPSRSSAFGGGRMPLKVSKDLSLLRLGKLSNNAKKRWQVAC